MARFPLQEVGKRRPLCLPGGAVCADVCTKNEGGLERIANIITPANETGVTPQVYAKILKPPRPLNIAGPQMEDESPFLDLDESPRRKCGLSQICPD